MKDALLILAALAAFAVIGSFAPMPVMGQSSLATCNNAAFPLCGIGMPQTEVQFKPQAVPTSATVIASQDAYLQTVTITNSTSGALTFTLSDRQASPIAALAAVSIAANSIVIVTWPDPYWCPNGFTVTASSTGLTMQGRFKQ